MSSEWSGEERREYCRLCKEDTNRSIKSACTKARISMYLTGTLLAFILGLTSLTWSAKSDVDNQKEILREIRVEQKSIAKDLNKITEFIELLKEGKISTDRRDNHRSN